MSHKYLIWVVLAAVTSLAGAPNARADLYQASAALEKRNLPRAFNLYRELAELGHAGAQEDLAVMYVNAEGVSRARNSKWDTARQQARLEAYAKGESGEGELIPF